MAFEVDFFPRPELVIFADPKHGAREYLPDIDQGARLAGWMSRVVEINRPFLDYTKTIGVINAFAFLSDVLGARKRLNLGPPQGPVTQIGIECVARAAAISRPTLIVGDGNFALPHRSMEGSRVICSTSEIEVPDLSIVQTKRKVQPLAAATAKWLTQLDELNIVVSPVVLHDDEVTGSDEVAEIGIEPERISL